jgi:CDP-diacylglycerol--glycerol-3-phosphate 3-phosphatidyltransferase
MAESSSMTATTNEPSRARVFNVPNQITAARLVLALVDFVLTPLGHYAAALVVFLLAASTDWVDGYWARRYGQVTKLGRVCDPFVDKIIICGMFIFLAGVPGSGIQAWMAVLVVARELLVTTLRTFIEQSGGDFSAKSSGKWKMFFQCVAVVASLLTLACGGLSAPAGLLWGLWISVGVAVLSTIQSGIAYVAAAGKALLD